MSATISPPAGPLSTEGWVSLPEAARLMGATWPSAYKRALKGDIEAVQIAGRWLVRRDSLSGLLADHGRVA